MSTISFIATVIKIDYRREPKVSEYLASEKWREVYNYNGMMSLVYSKICASSYWLLAVRISRRGWCLESNGPSCFRTPPEEPWLDPCEPVTETTLVLFIRFMHERRVRASPIGNWEKQPVAALIKVSGLSSAPAKRCLVKSGNVWHVWFRAVWTEAAESPLSHQSNPPEGGSVSNRTHRYEVKPINKRLFVPEKPTQTGSTPFCLELHIVGLNEMQTVPDVLKHSGRSLSVDSVLQPKSIRNSDYQREMHSMPVKIRCKGRIVQSSWSH